MGYTLIMEEKGTFGDVFIACGALLMICLYGEGGTLNFGTDELGWKILVY